MTTEQQIGRAVRYVIAASIADASASISASDRTNSTVLGSIGPPT
jgi:hypothetical protein